ncbi:hypothetical protein E2C01_057269 [Portunus trituberculatus]|uniref:Uncharacterized protein n=1 Tax=Portunus trituberculatus TaxID=210409 RepID=A0A5B7GWB8_PORTR|nr:hypothetical protein [Portunus trituberculatus]
MRWCRKAYNIVTDTVRCLLIAMRLTPPGAEDLPGASVASFVSAVTEPRTVYEQAEDTCLRSDTDVSGGQVMEEQDCRPVAGERRCPARLSCVQLLPPMYHSSPGRRGHVSGPA